MDIFFFEAFEEEEALLKSYLPKGVQAGFTKLTIQEYGAEHPPAPLISVRVQSIIPPEWGGLLLGIHSRSTGYEHLQRYLAGSGSKAQCGYLPLYCHRAVAEHALMLWMALLRKLPRQQKQFGVFKRDNITGWECEGKNLLVVGVGNIGYQVVKIGKGMGMQVSCVDVEQKFPDEHYVDIDEGMSQADVIVCAMDLNKTNYAYFTEERFAQTKPGAIFVNVSRGEISPSQVLLKLVQSGHLGGVGMDAFNKEEYLAVSLRQNQPSKDPEVRATLALMEYDQVICTPHNAFNTEESTDRKAEQSVEQLVHFLQKGTFKWPIPAE